MRKLVLLSACTLLFCVLQAQTWQDTVLLIEKTMQRYKPAGPGAQLAISRHGRLLYSRAFGMANLEHHVPLTTTSPTEAGSVSKQFTAAAILLLEQQGKLSLEDPVSKFFPELPAYASRITLRHMMQHTSGLKDWGSIAAVGGWPRGTRTYNNLDALEIIARQTTLNHEPGAEYIYSNSNYNLMALVVKRVSGMELDAFSKKYLFEPAGMTHTEWRSDFRKIVPNRAIAYSRTAEGYYTNMPNEFVYGNGGLLTTAEDLVAWNAFYHSGKLGNPSLWKAQTAVHPFNNGLPHNYAAGLVIDRHAGQKLVTHSGATAAYRANLDLFPDAGLSIAFLSNTSEFDRDSVDVVEQLRNIFFPQKESARNAHPAAAVNLPEQTLQSYAGWYRNTRSNSGLRLVVKEGKLVTAQNSPVTALSEKTFRLAGNLVEMMMTGKEAGLRLIGPGGDTTFFEKTAAVEVTPPYLAQFTGTYFSAEADARVEWVTKGNRLMARQRMGVEFPADATYLHGFDTPMGPVRFELNAAGQVKGFYLSVSRARNIWFARTQP